MKSVFAIAVLGLFIASVAAFQVQVLEPATPIKLAPELDLCPTCVSFTGQAIDQLLNIILNVGVVGSCGALCSLLPNKIEATVCNLLCDYVGIEEFVKLIEKADLDPIYFCELLKVCPIHDGGAARIESLTVNPPSGPQGSTFEIEMVFTVLNQTGTGEVVVGITPPDAFPFGDGELNEGFAPGSYGVKFQLRAEPSEQEPFTPGVYGVDTAVCVGECGSKHPHSAVLSTAHSNFTITA